MLDAFGKGASDDIQAAKSELYSQVADLCRQGPPSPGPQHRHPGPAGNVFVS